MANHDGDEIGIDAWLERFGADPVRLNALVLLSARPAGVSEVAEQLAVTFDAAAHHLDEMLEAGLIETVGEVLYGGKVEPRYRATTRVLWTDEEWATFSRAERGRLLAWILQTVNSDIAEALKSGTFFAHDNSHVIRTVVQVDDQGWQELSRIHEDALDAVLAVQAASAERLAESHEEGVPALSATFCCEMPSRRQAPS